MSEFWHRGWLVAAGSGRRFKASSLVELSMSSAPTMVYSVQPNFSPVLGVNENTSDGEGGMMLGNLNRHRF